MPVVSRLALSALLLTTPVLADELADQVTASRSAVKSFGTALKSELQAAIQAGGPLHAITVCNEKAPAIAAATATAAGLTISRTSLKMRNANNAPDAWELAILQQFEARKAAGEPAEQLEHYEIVEQDGQKTFRYMKAIPTAEVCLNCHGSQIKDDISAKLYELYPNDQARGFQAGDLRGAFTIERPL